jgi:hypothetical protein
MEPIEIGNLLQVKPGDLIQVPHCEPPSEVSTLRFSAYYAESGCGDGLVSLADALAALPGSEVIYGVNFGPPNYRTKWLRLPPTQLVCPCPGNTDWYGILKDLPRANVPEEPGPCSIESSQWCNPELDEENPKLGPNTYFKENEYPLGIGFLPPITPNQRD